MIKVGTIEMPMTFAGRADSSDSSRVVVAFQPDSDVHALTRRAAAGDEAAAREFFERYCDRLVRYALVMARGHEDSAREVLSVTMIKSIRHIRAMETDADVWRWLTRIARTSFIDICRKTQRQAPAETLSDTLAAPAIDSTLETALNESLAELPVEEQQIVESFYFEDQSQAALADENKTTRKAVESRLARIRQKLRAAILRKLA